MSNGDFMSIKESQGTSEIMVTNQWGKSTVPVILMNFELMNE